VLSCLATTLQAQPASSPVKAHETEHYRLVTDLPADRAGSASAVLEAAWRPLERFFGRAPRLRPGQRLVVKLMRDRDGFIAALRADDVEPPTGAGGYYWPANRTVYQYCQPTVYYTRQLLIHEAVHQFHFLSNTSNRKPRDQWYIEGLAEHLSRHTWDGTTLRLGVVPLVTLKDYPAKALSTMDRDDYSLATLVDSSRPSTRPEQWALLHWICTDAPESQRKKLFRSLDRGVPAKSCFKSFLGSPKRLSGPFRAWLRTRQEPWAPVFNEWEGIGPGAVAGAASVVSACRTKAVVAGISAVIDPGGGPRWSGGLLLHHRSAKDFSVFLLQPNGQWKVDQRSDGRWRRLTAGSVTLDNSKPIAISATRTDDQLTIRIAGDETATLPLPATPMGLALDNCRLRFSDVRTF